MKLPLAVDGSEYTKRMLSYVAAREELLGPAHEYVLCTVVTPILRVPGASSTTVSSRATTGSGGTRCWDRCSGSSGLIVR
jgi:hypothetical protein